MSEECVTDDLYATVDDDLAYIKTVELEFTARVDDMLKMLNLYHLRVKPGEGTRQGTAQPHRGGR